MSQSSPSLKAETGKGKPTSGDNSEKRWRIQLQVGEKVFSTTHHTLCKESAYFRSLLCHHDKQLKNEICFVDADPELFSYILRYLRHGIYPVTFSRSGGHDYVTYLGIERLATEFGIEKLTKWLVDKKYESAIKCAVSLERMKPSLSSWLDDTLPSRFHLSADHVNFLPDSNGVIWEVRKRFTARPEAILAVPRITLNAWLGGVLAGLEGRRTPNRVAKRFDRRGLMENFVWECEMNPRYNILKYYYCERGSDSGIDETCQHAQVGGRIGPCQVPVTWTVRLSWCNSTYKLGGSHE